MNPKTAPHVPAELVSELAELRAQLAEARETLEAIRTGAVDALIVSGPGGERVFSLEGAETPYRSLVEEINEGALLLRPDGTVLYANARFAQMVNKPLEKLMGSSWTRFFPTADHSRLEQLLQAARHQPIRQEFPLVENQGGAARPVLLSLSPLKGVQPETLSAVVTDLTERKQAEAALRQANEKLEARVRQRTADLVLSENRYRLLFNRNPDGVFAVDITGRFLLANPACELISGYPVSELLRKNFTDLCARDQLPKTLEHFKGALANSAPQQLETTLIRKDGRRVDVIISGEPAISEDGNVAVHCTAKDISQRKQAEEVLRQSEEMHRVFFELAAVGMVYVSPEGRILKFNDKYCEITGYSRAELAGLTVFDLTPPDELEREREAFGSYGRGEASVYTSEKRCLRKDSSMRWVAVTARMIRDAEGRPRHSIGIVEDIHERKRAEEALEAARKALQAHAENLEKTVQERTAKLHATIDELHHVSYAMVHDMRAPLRALQGFAELIGQQGDDCSKGQAAEYRRRIIVAAQRLDSLITDALSYTKILHEEVQLKPVDLRQLIVDLVQTYPNLHPEKADIQIEGTLPRVMGTQSFLTQCFSNLLGNAVKFVSPGTRPQIRIAAELLSPAVGSIPEGFNLVRIWVVDNGIGISKPNHRRLFGMFQKLDKDFEGTGIGLAIVRKVVERMGGKVGVESGEGQGSRFWVELRLAGSITSALVEQPCNHPTDDTNPAPAAILLAEDEETDVMLFRHAFSQACLPNPLFVVGDGLAAIKYLHGDGQFSDRTRHPLPALFLLDLKMPQMDGFAVLAWRQSRPELKHVPVIVLTSSVDDSDKTRALDLGASEYRIKPSKPQALVDLLRELHGRWLSPHQNRVPAPGLTPQAAVVRSVSN